MTICLRIYWCLTNLHIILWARDGLLEIQITTNLHSTHTLVATFLAIMVVVIEFWHGLLITLTRALIVN